MYRAAPQSRLRRRTRPQQSQFEALLQHNPISASLLRHCATVDLICLRNTSRCVRACVDKNPRFFRHLVFVKRASANWGKLLRQLEAGDLDSFDRLAPLVESLRMSHLKRYDEETLAMSDERYSISCFLDCVGAIEAKEVVERYRKRMEELEKSVAQRPRKTPPKKKEAYYSITNQQLIRTLYSLPVGRNIASLVIDGTGVETVSMERLLNRLSGRLRVISAKNCPNIDCSLWGDWLCTCIYYTKPIALKTLQIWGSGNLPIAFDSNAPFEPLEPTFESDVWLDEQQIMPDIKDSGDVSHKWVFANILPLNYHEAYTRLLFTPRYLWGVRKADWELQMVRILDAQLPIRFGIQTRTREAFITYWEPPPYPFGEVNPVIVLLAMADYCKIKLDFGLCANEHRCFSFRTAGQTPGHLHEGGAPPTRSNLVLQAPTMNSMAEIDTHQEQILHTHVLSETGGRRAQAGELCERCGLWEDEPMHEGFLISNVTHTVAGVTTGAGIGPGRGTMGSLCPDCVVAQTCISCKRFTCHNCLFPEETQGENPLVDYEAPVVVPTWYCEQNSHGPYCADCIAKNEDFFRCSTCKDPDGITCLKCFSPNGVLGMCSVFGDEIADDPAMCKVTPLATHPVGRLLAVSGLNKWFAEQGVIAEEDTVVSEHRTFEICANDRCRKMTCLKCNIKDREQVEYDQCIGCHRRFCGSCDVRLTVCGACGNKKSILCKWCRNRSTWTVDDNHTVCLSRCRSVDCAREIIETRLAELKGPWEETGDEDGDTDPGDDT
ncbi:hypothetical protein EDC01DRAFT_629414 [Geopyxis carbonaria]|nr:hypothetical protein EDC01DRAFT_629414 [Geopyxis carbonaria]